MNKQLAMQAATPDIARLLSMTSQKLAVRDEWKYECTYFRVHKSGETAIMGLHARNPEADIFVKRSICLNDTPKTEVTSEFRMTQSVYNALPDKHRSLLARPICRLDDMYASEWVDLPKLKSALVLGRFSPGKRRRFLETAAGALRVVHTASGLQHHPLDTQALIRHAAGTGCTDDGWLRAFDSFKQLARRFDGRLVECCRLHGDYSPENILYSPQRTVIIDFSGGCNAPVMRDVCHFVMYYALYCGNVFNPNPVNTLLADMHAFANAYHRQTDTRDDEHMTFMLLLVLLVRWRRHQAKATDAARKPQQRMLDALMARRARACCRAIETQLAGA